MSGKPDWLRQLDWIQIPDSVEFRIVHSLRRNNSAQRMTPGQHDATMIDFGCRRTVLAALRQAGPLNQCTAASRTPIRLSLLIKHRPALAANPFHAFKITGSAHAASGSVH